MQPYKLSLPLNQTNCVLFNSPHSGSIYTDKFMQLTDLSLRTLRSSEDLFVDQLFSPVVGLGSLMLSAKFPRSFIEIFSSALTRFKPALHLIYNINFATSFNDPTVPMTLF